VNIGIYLLFALTIGANQVALPTGGLDQAQLIGNRIPFVVEPQSQFLYGFAVDTIEGNYFLPWTKSDYRVYGRLFGPHGGKKAPLQSFQGGSIPGQSRRDGVSRVVFNPTDRQYLVVWSSVFGNPKYDPVAFELRGQFVSSEGRAIGASRVISQEGLYFRKLIHNSKDNQYALFYSFYPDNKKPPVLGLQRLDAQGQILGKARELNSSSDDSNTAADIAYDPRKNQYLVVWALLGLDPSLVRYRIVSADLKTLGPVHTVENTTSLRSSPVALYDQNKRRFVILWNNGEELKVRGIASDGSPKTNIVSLGDLNLADYKFTAMVNPSSGTFLISYLILEGGGAKLILLRIDRNFFRLGEPFLGSSQNGRIHRSDVFLRYSPSAEEFMLIWSYLERSPNSLDIYGQRVRGIPRPPAAVPEPSLILPGQAGMIADWASVAQSVERLIRNQQVEGSSPPAGLSVSHGYADQAPRNPGLQVLRGQD
jgi:hypothetical protein